MKKVRIGIIGTGVGIRTHLNGFRLFEAAEVLAICGSSLERSREFAQKFSIPIACASYEDLCDNADIDLVCITSPNRFHYDAVKYAISKGKHIVCEKPLSDNVEEVRALINAAKKYPKIAVIDHQLRFNPYIRKIKEMITNGDLGDVISVKLNQQGTGFANPIANWTWSFDGEQGGGVRLAMASHFNDLIQFWFDKRKIISINGYMNPVTKKRTDLKGVVRDVTASTICTAHIDLEDELNVQYFINAGSYVGSRFDISIFGSKGELTYTLQDKISFYSRDNIGTRQEILVEGVYEDEQLNKVSIFSGSFRYFAPLIIKAIQNDDFSYIDIATTFSEAQYNIKILDGIKQSANTGTGVVLGKGENQYV